MITLPDNCPRGKLETCTPLDQIVSDDLVTFICCGLIHSDEVKDGDIFRVCFKSVDTDSEYALNHTDMFDQIAVMSKAIAVEDRLTRPGLSRHHREREIE